MYVVNPTYRQARPKGSRLLLRRNTRDRGPYDAHWGCTRCNGGGPWYPCHHAGWRLAIDKCVLRYIEKAASKELHEKRWQRLKEFQIPHFDPGCPIDLEKRHAMQAVVRRANVCDV